ncbi:MAG: threonylcarbamoyl-AMP synthase [Clostridiales Family XIII bacterium]|jgi:L-threonylcarbamoyladenylate synthase|nr:threonylcarbamoyl-AMP synthase [Clostridiales Family XIII bacterium]
MINKNIDSAIELLRRGEVVAIPTETVYGLAANIYNPDAIEKIFIVKQRPKNDPLIVHIHDVAQLNEVVTEIPDKAKVLMEKFWPGPLTFLLKKSGKVPDDVTSGSKFVAIRMPNHPLTLQLLSKINFPLAAPSANLFQKTSPTTPQHVEQQLGDKIPLILDGGECWVGVESTIIGFDEEDEKIINIFRLGGISVEKIKAAINCNLVIKSGSCNLPGNSKLHYSTNKPLLVGDIDELLQQHKDKKIGVLSFEKKYNAEYQVLLSEEGDLNQAAKNLYKSMKILDAMPVEIILAELVPDENLGKTINDRLIRASYK